MSCSNTDAQPLKLTLQNVTLTDDGKAESYGVAFQIGTPGQILSLAPTITLNNTFVNNIANCGSSPNASCIAQIGGGYDPSKSSTLKRTTADSWNGSQEVNPNNFANTASLYFNDVLTVGDVELPGFPSIVQNTPLQLFAGLALGQNSTFINRLVDAGLAASRSWSLSYGAYSPSRVGSLIIGGYSKNLYEGELITKNVTEDELLGGLCQACFDLANLTWSSNGREYTLMPSLGAQPFQVIIDPYYPLFVMPDSVTWAWGNATNGTWRSENYAHSYGQVPDGNMTVTLSNGLRTVIPSEALFTPTVQDNGWVKSYMPTANSNFSVIIPWSVFYGMENGDVPDRAIFGIPYAAFVYLVRDYERSTLAIANSNQYSLGGSGNNVTTICPLESNRQSGDGSGTSNTAAIAGGVVGGVVGLALIAGLIWYFMRRKKKSKQNATTSDTDKDTKAELAQDSAVLPKYSEHDSLTNSAKGANTSTVPELSNEHRIVEADSATSPVARELPARETNSARVELPG